MSPQLVLSLFPGADLLGLAFELEGFCVVQGPDLKWGRDVRDFHVPRDRFDGVIGGPPCQTHSTMKHLALKGNGVPAGEKHGDQIPEFQRIVREARPSWFLMENVSGAPTPWVAGYEIAPVLVHHDAVGGDTTRVRRFTMGMWDAKPNFVVESAALFRPDPEPTVLAGHGPAMGQRVRGIQGRSWQQMAELQGIPAAVVERLAEDAPYTVHGLKSLIGNGVPLPMGRAVARAVKRALGLELSVERSPA